MPVSFESSYQDQGGSSESATLAATGTDKLLLAIVGGRRGSTTTLNAMSIGGEDCVGVGSATADGSGEATTLGYGHILNDNHPGSGGQTILPSFGSGLSNIVYTAVELSGVNQTNPVETPITVVGTDLADGAGLSVNVSGHDGKMAVVWASSCSGSDNDGAGGNGLPAGAVSLGDYPYGRNRVHVGYIAALASNDEDLAFTFSTNGSAIAQSATAGVLVINDTSEGNPEGIDSVSGDNVIVSGESVTVDWFSGATGTTSTTLNGVAQTSHAVVSDTETSFDFVWPNALYGEDIPLVIDGETKSVQVVPVAANDYVTLFGYDENDTDITGVPDLADDKQLEYERLDSNGNDVSISPSGFVTLTGAFAAGTVTVRPVDTDGTLGPYVTLGAGTPPADMTPPAVTAPDNVTIEYAYNTAGLPHSDATLQALVSSASATDETSPTSPAVTNNLGSLPNPLPAGLRTITFSATDAAGNTGQANTTITVVQADPPPADTIPPVVTPPDDVTIEFPFNAAGLPHDNALLQTFRDAASAVDAVSPASPAVSDDIGDLDDPIPAGTYTVAFSATDDAGNEGTATAELTVARAVDIGVAVSHNTHAFNLNGEAFTEDGTFNGHWMSSANPDAVYAVLPAVTVSGGVVTAFNGIAFGDYTGQTGVLTLHNAPLRRMAAIDTAGLAST